MKNRNVIILGLIGLLFFFPFIALAQKFDKCRTQSKVDVPKYKIGRWERDDTGTLLIFIGLKSRKINENGLIDLAAHLENRFCKEERVSFWIFDDYRWARRGPFDHTGSFYEAGKKSSIAGYNFDRISGENFLTFRLDGNYGITGYLNRKLSFEKPSPRTP